VHRQEPGATRYIQRNVLQTQLINIKCEERERERERENKMQQSDGYYQLLSQHVSGIIMPVFRRTKTECYCMWCTELVLLDVVGSGCGALRCRALRCGVRAV